MYKFSPKAEYSTLTHCAFDTHFTLTCIQTRACISMHGYIAKSAVRVLAPLHPFAWYQVAHVPNVPIGSSSPSPSPSLGLLDLLDTMNS